MTRRRAVRRGRSSHGILAVASAGSIPSVGSVMAAGRTSPSSISNSPPGSQGELLWHQGHGCKNNPDFIQSGNASRSATRAIGLVATIGA